MNVGRMKDNEIVVQFCSTKGQTWRAKRSLELVHLDVRYVEVSSNSGSKYFITFIDDFNRKNQVYFWKHKYVACNAFKQFLAYVKKQSNYSTKLKEQIEG